MLLLWTECWEDSPPTATAGQAIGRHAEKTTRTGCGKVEEVGSPWNDVRVADKFDDVRRKSAWRALRDRFDPDPTHSDAVWRLSLRLFDGLVDLHGLDLSSRDLLEAAALLHDIGWSGGCVDHHKRSRDLVRAADLPGTTEADREAIALLCRLHRGKVPTDESKGLARLTPPRRVEVRKLAAILRIADALDRSHRNAVVSLAATVDGRVVIIRVLFVEAGDEERYGFEKKKGLFEEVYGRAVRLVPGVRRT